MTILNDIACKLNWIRIALIQILKLNSTTLNEIWILILIQFNNNWKKMRYKLLEKTWKSIHEYGVEKKNFKKI